MKLKYRLILMLSSFWAANPIQAQTYVAHATATQIRLINTETAQSEVIYTGSGVNFNGLAWNAEDRRLYVVDTTVQNSQRLYSLDPFNASAGLTSHGVLRNAEGNPVVNTVYGATFDNTGSGLYLGIVTTSKRISTWDVPDMTSAGQYDLNLGSLNWSGLQLGDIAVDGDGGLWISATNIMLNQSALLRYASLSDAINGGTPTVYHHDTSGAGNIINGLGYDAEKNLLYGFRESTKTFYSINPSNGNLTPVFVDSVFTPGDLSDAFSTNPVPEPTSVFLAGMGGMFVLLRRGRRVS